MGLEYAGIWGTVFRYKVGCLRASEGGWGSGGFSSLWGVELWDFCVGGQDLSRGGFLPDSHGSPTRVVMGCWCTKYAHK